MADDIDRDDVSAPAAEPAPAPRRKRHWGRRILTAVILIPLLVLSLWTAIALNWSYSQGDRSGYVQKFSKKGFICKTWEGELAIVNIPGSQPEIFQFTVKNDSVAELLRRVMGDRVTLTYEQHMGVPFSCFGDTQYYVTAVRPITELSPTPPMPPVPVGPGATTTPSSGQAGGATTTPAPGTTPATTPRP
jgi:hypothetical protein